MLTYTDISSLFVMLTGVKGQISLRESCSMISMLALCNANTYKDRGTVICNSFNANQSKEKVFFM